MKIGKIVLTSIVLWIVGIVFVWLTCGWLFNWVYLIPPTDIWLPMEMMMGTGNLIISNAIGLLTTFLFVLVYTLLYKSIPGEGIKKGLWYGFLVWLIAPLTGMITMAFYMTIAWGVIIYWIIQALVLYLLYGLILGMMYKDDKE